MKYLVSFFNGASFGHAVFCLDRLSEDTVDYIVSELKKSCGSEDVVIISIVRLEE